MGLFIIGMFSLVVLIMKLVRHFEAARIAREYGEMDQRNAEFNAIVRQMNEQSKARTFFEPRDLLQSNGYYIHYDDNNDIRRLLNADKELVIDRDFRHVHFVTDANTFLCEHEGGTSVFDATNGNIYETEFRAVWIDDYGNKVYSTDLVGYGVLDEHYKPLTTPVFQSLSAVSIGYFQYKGSGASHVIDKRGNMTIRQAKFIAEYAVDGKILVQQRRNQWALFCLDGEEFKALNYDHVALVAHPYQTRKHNPVQHYIASTASNSAVGELSIKTYKHAVLNADGFPVFTSEYDTIRRFPTAAQVAFIVGLGDIQLWNYCTDEIENYDGELSGEMFFGVVNEQGEVLIPIAYSELEAIPDTNLCCVKKGGNVAVYEDEDEYHDEPYKYWEITGGVCGVIDLSGQEIIPVEYVSISHTTTKDASGIIFRARKTEEGEVICFDANGRAL